MILGWILYNSSWGGGLKDQLSELRGGPIEQARELEKKYRPRTNGQKKYRAIHILYVLTNNLAKAFNDEKRSSIIRG